MSKYYVSDKPPGLTSKDFVDSIKQKENLKKVCYCGRLDPMARGQMIILGDLQLLPSGWHTQQGSPQKLRNEENQISWGGHRCVLSDNVYGALLQHPEILPKLECRSGLLHTFQIAAQKP